MQSRIISAAAVAVGAVSAINFEENKTILAQVDKLDYTTVKSADYDPCS